MYDTACHRKLSGRIWAALSNEQSGIRHDSNRPGAFCYSNIQPWGAIEKGDSRQLLIASPHTDVLPRIKSDFRERPHLRVGDMTFRIEDTSSFDVTVGEAGTKGVLETTTGVLVKLQNPTNQDCGMENAPDSGVTYWRPEHSLKPFITAVRENARRKHERFAPEELPDRSNRDVPLFESYELTKTYALPVTVTEGHERTLILSKWRFGYHVRDEHHRRQLNCLLDCGVGARNALGFGFLNPRFNAQ